MTHTVMSFIAPFPPYCYFELFCHSENKSQSGDEPLYNINQDRRVYGVNTVAILLLLRQKQSWDTFVSQPL